MSEPGFTGLKDLQDFAMQRKNPVRDGISIVFYQYVAPNGATNRRGFSRTMKSRQGCNIGRKRQFKIQNSRKSRQGNHINRKNMRRRAKTLHGVSHDESPAEIGGCFPH
jgi:hypothetical protein